MTVLRQQRLISPSSITDATKVLGDLGEEAQVLAGGTWIMRAPIRGEYSDKVFVSLANIVGLHSIEIDTKQLNVGAMATHHQLAEMLKDAPDLHAVQKAAEKSANPSVRRMATVGGNICRMDFLAPDLVPALIACDAVVFLQSNDDEIEMPLEHYIETRADRPGSELLTKVNVKRGSFRSSHTRILMRQAGEYPVANLSLRCEIDSTDSILNARIAVGAVDRVPKRWKSLEDAVNGRNLSKMNASELAKQNLNEFTGRDGADAPGWYRIRVLPRLASDAFAATSQIVS